MRVRTPRRLLTLAIATMTWSVVAGALPASAAITPATAPQIAAAIAADPALVTGASFATVPPQGTPNGTADSVLASFPRDGSTFGILTSGDVNLADEPNNSGSSGASDGGANVRGNTDFDVTIIKVDLSVPAGSNCLSVDFRFLSDEFPEFVNSGYNDAFIAELDTSNWSTSGSTISAPNNFAFSPDDDDPDSDPEVISINSTGAANMSASEATGTTYDGATNLLRASTQVTPGAHSLYLSIFDQQDSSYDSAVFLDNLAIGTTTESGCQPGATLPPPTVSKSADQPSSPPGGTNGYTITVSNPNDEPVELDSISDDLPVGFSYVNGSTSGDVDSNPTITGQPSSGQTLVWEPIEGSLVTIPANGSISLHFNVTVAETPDEYFNDASATAGGFTIAPTGPTAPITVEGEPEPQPPTVSKTADASTSTPGAANGYTITVTNPNEGNMGVNSITDQLPDGFTYTPGSATLNDASFGDPSQEGQTLTWESDPLLTIPGGESITLHFGVTVASAQGTYLNEASVQASGFDAQSTGETASIAVAEQTPEPPPPSPAAQLPPAGACDPLTIKGTAVGDTLVGGELGDRIDGLAGRDLVDGAGADDVLCGGDGSDYLYGRQGSDTIRAEQGNDRLYGGRHNDTMIGGPGHDAFVTGRGVDTVDAADGTSDCIRAKAGDTLILDNQDLVNPKGGCGIGFWQ